MGCPCDKILEVAEHWEVACCSPVPSSLAAVPAGLCRTYTFIICLLGLTPCALNGLPHHGIQVPSQKKKKRGLAQRQPFSVKRGVKQGDVRNPLLVCAGLEYAIRKWKIRVQHCGLHCGDDELLRNVRYAVTWCYMQKLTFILQVWPKASLKNWPMSVYTCTPPRPK